MKNLVFTLFFSLFIGCSCADDIPVVFIHKSDSTYLKDSFWQAQQYNKRVILIGDRTNGHYPGIEHYLIEDYFSEAAKFSEVYQHQSVNPYGYELFCFQRWFILKEFMEKNQIEKCFYCDSDIMLYCDISKDFENYRQYQVSLVHCGSCCSGHSSYFTLQGLQDVCQFFIEFYQNFESNRLLDTHISDMHVLLEYANYNKEVGLLQKIADNSRYDINVSQEGDLYAMKSGMKDIVWFNQQPCCYHKFLNQYIRFKTLHFQGDKKRFMEKYRQGNPVSFSESAKLGTIEHLLR